MKKYIAPACEIVNLASTEMLALSFKVDPNEKADQLSNRYLDFDDEWDEE